MNDRTSQIPNCRPEFGRCRRVPLNEGRQTRFSRKPRLLPFSSASIEHRFIFWSAMCGLGDEVVVFAGLLLQHGFRAAVVQAQGFVLRHLRTFAICIFRPKIAAIILQFAVLCTPSVGDTTNVAAAPKATPFLSSVRDPHQIDSGNIRIGR